MTTAEGREIENLISSLRLSQLISEPTNFDPNKNPSCIDLVTTEQPNLVLDCETRASLDSFCFHQITYCKVNLTYLIHTPLKEKSLLMRSMSGFPWEQHLSINPNWQVKTFTKIFLNIMSNFLPSEMKRIVPCDPPWITKPLKTMLNRKNRLLRNYKRHGYNLEDKVRLDNFRNECQETVKTAKVG